MTAPVFRFAPSPNGHLHLGHALSALLNFDMARRRGGRFVLRIEDIDAARCRPEYEAAIYEDLAWLGLTWEEPVLRQSSRAAAYGAALQQLDAMGVVYPSFESRAEIVRLVAERDRAGGWPRDPDGVPLYPGRAKGLPAAERRQRLEAGDPFALRLDVVKAIALVKRRGGEAADWIETGAGPDGESGRIAGDPAAWGDVVLARREVPTSYHLSVVVDDAYQGVTEVVRGQDLFHATSVHRLLQNLLGLGAPVYHHHRLVRDACGRKLSKATGATGLRELRAGGATGEEVRRMVGLA
ncbi:MAG: tRNA glutamyl-Q(34) synthetase GluQRS [Bradyrhizobiaceae bacterium]|nr:tRNA glutamyl-Q(34) synthetase GluQRS [Bradyrhizobiaceae bacterium]